ncbi:Kdo hydroxylase family protein [Methylomagnum sp.]
MSLDIIHECGLDTWNPSDLADGLESVLESGGVLYFPHLGFRFAEDEKRFQSERWSDGKAKNISYRGPASPLQGARGTPEELAHLKAALARYADSAESLVKALFPHYAPHLKRGFTSYRTAPVEGRVTSWRKDDTRLHVDAFPSNPTGGLRLLRVFANVNPHGMPRVWRVGEPFEPYAQKFLPQAPKPWPGSAWLMEKLGLTKSRRTRYDHYMNQLHDLGKADLNYQASSPQLTFPFPAGTAWVVYSDQVLHTVVSGQYLLEQTFYLDPGHMARPDTAPLRVLERLTGRALI